MATSRETKSAAGGDAVLRIGVTGHRAVADEDRVRSSVLERVRRLRVERGADIVEIWSSLAEGADRIVADLVPLDADRLVVVLPLETSDYRHDFATPSSIAHFDRLVSMATSVDVTGPDGGGDRESAYERAGLTVVANSDVLLALWDGEDSRGRGGTAEIVERARRDHREVVVIPVRRADTTVTDQS